VVLEDVTYDLPEDLSSSLLLLVVIVVRSEDIERRRVEEG